MKKQKKNNNKGFSLVELIVVVLIMAIIAVALAPQVIKWVDNSRIATDVQTYDAMYANAQLALTNKAAYTEANAATEANPIVITITDGAAASVSGATHVSFEAALADICVLDDAKAKVTDASYKIYVYQGKVYRATEDDEFPNGEDVDN